MLFINDHCLARLRKADLNAINQWKILMEVIYLVANLVLWMWCKNCIENCMRYWKYHILCLMVACLRFDMNYHWWTHVMQQIHISTKIHAMELHMQLHGMNLRWSMYLLHQIVFNCSPIIIHVKTEA